VLSFREKEPRSMLAQVISIKLQDRESKKGGGVSSITHTAKGVAILWRNATSYMDILIQTSKEAS